MVKEAIIKLKDEYIMRKLLSIITVIAILGILATVAVFEYNKYQEVELEKRIAEIG
ncbi:hypothetical protein ACQ23P_12280 [Staphylococcus cohnii]|uniref:hypothetical protein n=1 Tax=Staphylococcus TaxID=1279 RepID=UPI00130066B0|nr:MULTISPECIES: hypothetical protein [Staphylococcus]MCE5034846.1 hypothetical protein [Staphylococcus cohnii]MDU0462311.1 hypothetical protein [Staphylococcus ureilyticus]